MYDVLQFQLSAFLCTLLRNHHQVSSGRKQQQQQLPPHSVEALMHLESQLLMFIQKDLFVSARPVSVFRVLFFLLRVGILNEGVSWPPDNAGGILRLPTSSSSSSSSSHLLFSDFLVADDVASFCSLTLSRHAGYFTSIVSPSFHSFCLPPSLPRFLPSLRLSV